MSRNKKIDFPKEYHFSSSQSKTKKGMCNSISLKKPSQYLKTEIKEVTRSDSIENINKIIEKYLNGNKKKENNISNYLKQTDNKKSSNKYDKNESNNIYCNTFSIESDEFESNHNSLKPTNQNSITKETMELLVSISSIFEFINKFCILISKCFKNYMDKPNNLKFCNLLKYTLNNSSNIMEIMSFSYNSLSNFLEKESVYKSSNILSSLDHLIYEISISNNKNHYKYNKPDEKITIKSNNENKDSLISKIQTFEYDTNNSISSNKFNNYCVNNNNNLTPKTMVNFNTKTYNSFLHSKNKNSHVITSASFKNDGINSRRKKSMSFINDDLNSIKDKIFNQIQNNQSNLNTKKEFSICPQISFSMESSNVILKFNSNDIFYLKDCIKLNSEEYSINKKSLVETILKQFKQCRDFNDKIYQNKEILDEMSSKMEVEKKNNLEQQLIIKNQKNKINELKEINKIIKEELKKLNEMYREDLNKYEVSKKIYQDQKLKSDKEISSLSEKVNVRILFLKRI